MVSISIIMLKKGWPLILLALFVSICKADYLVPLVSKNDPWRIIVKSLKYRYPGEEHRRVAVVNVSEQRLFLYDHGDLIKKYRVSTSRYGVGNRDGSYKTPLGLHRVVDKIGENAPLGLVFKARKPTDRIARIYKSRVTLPYDLVTTRILRLKGLEPGINNGNGIDTYQRHIYIHGTHEEGMIGQPASIGCVRMTNKDIVDLFEAMPNNSLVLIVQGRPTRMSFVSR